MLSTEVRKGGAARAMVRSADALRKLGHVVYLVTLSPDDTDDHFVVQAVESGTSAKADRVHQFYNGYYVNAINRAKASNTLFWVPSIGFDVSRIIADLQVDVINIHWTSYFLSMKSLQALFSLGPPIVFTLHDMGVLTGGCHYSAGCQGFQTDCGSCPQLRIDPLRLPRRIMSRKRPLFEMHKPWVISPSPWLAEQARLSRLFEPDRIDSVSNTLNTKVFSPSGREPQRSAWNLNNRDIAILFGAYDNSERRKGFDLMLASIEKLVEHWSKDKPEVRINVIIFGENAPDLKISGVRFIKAGYIDNDEELANVYAGCDVVALSSREDNQPNVMMEGLACGVPVVAFKVGGMADYIDEQNGLLAEPFDVGNYARCLDEVLSRRQADAQWAAAISRRTAEQVNEFSHGMKCIDLFQSAVAQSEGSPQTYEIYRPSPMTSGHIEHPAVSMVEWF